MHRCFVEVTLLLVGFVVLAANYNALYRKLKAMAPAFAQLLLINGLLFSDYHTLPLYLRRKALSYLVKLKRSSRPKEFLFSLELLQA